MSFILILLLLILLVILAIVSIVLYLYFKSRDALKQCFGTTNIKEIIEVTEFEHENTPKSVSSLESVYLNDITSDFPELNINELKRIAEKYITYYLTASNLEDDNILLSDKMKKIIKNKIKSEKNIKYTDINFHKTVIKKYENKDGIYTISFNTSLEYMLDKGKKSSKKVQDRYSTELIYIIDYEKYHDNTESLGLNCPNCGAPVKTLKHKTCEYCGSGVVDLVKKNWILNNIVKY